MKITLLPGDGIGPEIVDASVEVLNAAAKKFCFDVTYDKQLIGGCAIDATGVPMPEATVVSAKAADAVLLGAVGGPKWDNVA
ncbi:MAG: 3-isopropylmalate dehydrogenase, partial [Phascolarctobacterium sp.]|nr:3-isopropylmalate dehydrogenase [Phascolarctobacterium sp.]